MRQEPSNSRRIERLPFNKSEIASINRNYKIDIFCGQIKFTVYFDQQKWLPKAKFFFSFHLIEYIKFNSQNIIYIFSNNAIQYTIVLNNLYKYIVQDQNAVLPYLTDIIQHCVVAYHAPLAYRSTVVQKNNNYVIFCGEANTGKTTSLLLFLENGYDYVSDAAFVYDAYKEVDYSLRTPITIRGKPNFMASCTTESTLIPVFSFIINNREYTMLYRKELYKRIEVDSPKFIFVHNKIDKPRDRIESVEQDYFLSYLMTELDIDSLSHHIYLAQKSKYYLASYRNTDKLFSEIDNIIRSTIT